MSIIYNHEIDNILNNIKELNDNINKQNEEYKITYNKKIKDLLT